MSRDIGRAIDLALEATALFPNDAFYWNTLGVAQYRAGSWKDAALAMEKARQLNAHFRNDSAVLFFLSMAYGQLKENDQARAFYTQAVQWRMAIGTSDEELRSLCAEAAALLVLEVPPTLQEPPVLTPGPTLVAPATGAILDNGSRDKNKVHIWEFAWSDVPGAKQYHLYVNGAKAKGPILNSPSLTSSFFRSERTG